MLTVRRKLSIGVWLVLAMVGTLTAGSLWAISSYREVVNDLDRSLNKVPRRQDLIEALAGLMEPLLPTTFPDSGYGRFDRQVMFQKRLAVAAKRTDNALLKLGDLPPLPQFTTTREIAKDRLWEINRRLQELQPQLKSLKDAQAADATTARLLLEVGQLQTVATGLPDFGTDLSRLLRSSRETYEASFWWVTVATISVGLLFIAGFVAGRRWIATPWAMLVEGTSRVAQGKFEHRVRLNTHDEFAELADNFNRMTDRFVEIRNNLELRARELAEQRERQDRLAGLGFLAAGIAHELNNPLTAVRWTSESLLTRFTTLFGTVSPANATLVENYLKMIQSEADRCQQITSRLLDFARGGEGQRALHDLTQIVREVMQLVRAMTKYHHCQIVFERTEPCVLEINGNEIKQVVLNLVANGLDAIEDASQNSERRPRLSGPTVSKPHSSPTPRGSNDSNGFESSRPQGPGLQVSERQLLSVPSSTDIPSLSISGRLEIRLLELTDHVEIEFADTGCGMTPDILRKIFDPFFTTKPSGQGTGLGLPICHRIVTEHGGQLAAISAGRNLGSTFRLSLPRVAVAQRVA